MQNNTAAVGAQRPAQASTRRGTHAEYSILFAYRLDEQQRPEIWDVRLVHDGDCGTNLQTFRLNADSGEKFERADLPDGNRLDRIYKVQIQDDSPDAPGAQRTPPTDLEELLQRDCLFLLETVPVEQFSYREKSLRGRLLGGIIEFLGRKDRCKLTGYSSFDATLLLAPLLAPLGAALWRFSARVAGVAPDDGPPIDWTNFSFFSRAEDTNGDPITGTANFHRRGERLRASLEAALVTSKETSGRQWDLPIDNVTDRASIPILGHLDAVIRGFPAGSFSPLTIDLGVSLLGKQGPRCFTLSMTSRRAERRLGDAYILGYDSLVSAGGALRATDLEPVDGSDTAELRISARPHPGLAPGPGTTGNPHVPSLVDQYTPIRQSILQFQSIPTRIFIKSWNSRVKEQLDSLKLTRAGNPVSFAPMFLQKKNDPDYRVWVLTYQTSDQSLTGIQSQYTLAVPYQSATTTTIPFRSSGQSTRSIELISMHPGRYSDQGESDSAGLPQKEDLIVLEAKLLNLNPIHARGPVEGLQAFIRIPRNPPMDPALRGIYFDFAGPIVADADKWDVTAPRVRMGSFDLTILRSPYGKPGMMYVEPGVNSSSEGIRSERLYGQLKLSETGQSVVDIKLDIEMTDFLPGGQDHSPVDEYAPQYSEWFPSSSGCESGVLVRELSRTHGEDGDTSHGPFYEGMFEEENPLTIFVPPEDRSTKYSLRVVESFRTTSSHTVDLLVRNVLLDADDPRSQLFIGLVPDTDLCQVGNSGNEAALSKFLNRVFVIDRNPFLIAQVAFLPVGLGSPEVPFARWTNRADQPHGWQVNFSQQDRSTVSPVCVTLPPQGLGETMLDEKNKSPEAAGLSEEEFYNRLSWFNYSPPTSISLSVDNEGLIFTAAPWNLRNLLSTRSLAPYVKRLDFELFYGLSCIAEQPLIRLLDTFAIVGHVPARPSPELAWKPLAAEAEAAEAYKARRVEWAHVYRRLRNRLAVLEPVPLNSSALDPSIVLQKNLSCWVRLPDASNLKPPKEIRASDLPSNEEGQNKYKALRAATLQGGVTNGFVSKNVYLASVFNNHRQSIQSRVSDSAQLSQFSFTALGGSGHQMAGFQNNLTRIYADVHLGRAYRYKVERIGRIACFWNVAKHVVVYERRVAPAKRFSTNKQQEPKKQPPQLQEVGWPYIRKVEEFVEIIDDKLDFPPALGPETSGPSAPVAELRRRSACITGIEFQPGQRFNVKSDWGVDVGDWGWKIPLWEPSEGKRNPEVYPEPSFHLRLAPHDSRDRAHELKRFRNPEQVYFFTLTKLAQPGGGTADPPADPHDWPPQAGIDFVNLPDPVPARDFLNGDPRQYTSPEAHHPVGFSPITFDLETSGPPINLTEGRNDSPVAVQLSTITVSRSLPSTQPLAPVDWTNLTSAKEVHLAALRDLERRLTELFRLVLREFPVGQVLEPGLGEKVTKVVNERFVPELKKLRDNAKALKNQLANGSFGQEAVKEQVQTVEEEALERVRNRINDVVVKANSEMKDRIRDLQNSPTFDPAEAAAILEDLGARIAEPLLLIGSAPGQGPRYIAQMTGRLALYIDQVRREFPDALDRIKAFANQPARTLADCQRQLRIEYAKLQSIEDDFFRCSTRYLPTGLPDALAGWRTNLSSYFGLFDQHFSAAIRATRKDEFINRLDAVAAPALDNLDQIKDFLRKFSSFSIDQANDWDSLVNHIRGQILATSESISKPWADAVGAAQNVTIDSFADFDAARIALLNTITDENIGISKALIDQAAAAKNGADKLTGLLDSAFSAFEEELNRVEKEFLQLAQDLANNVDQMQAEIIRYKDRLVSSARDWAEQCAAPLIGEFTNSAAYQTGDSALRLVRALGDPPRTSQMKFEQSQLGYYFKQHLPGVDLSPAFMALDQGAAALEGLKPLGLRLPCTQILEQMIPSKLENFDFRTIFPNFAGVDFSSLLPGITVPAFLDSRHVKVTHGLDRERRRAYAKATVNFTLDKPATILDIGPVKLEVPSADFQSALSIAAGESGIEERQVSGSIQGDWALALAGADLITLGDAKLLFNDHGGIRFEIDPSKVRLPDFLKFVTEELAGIVDSDSGLSFGAIPGGFQCILNLPVPDTSAVTSGISGLSLSADLALLYDQQFAIQIGCALGRPDKPFNVAFFILGGGGYCYTAVKFTPATGRFECLIDLRVTASASLSIALGPIYGGVYVYLGVKAGFRTGGGANSFGVIFIIRGDVSICGIVSAYVALTLSASYRQRAITGEGRLDMEIKICWCFTLKVHQSLTYTLHLGKHRDSGDALAENRAFVSDFQFPVIPVTARRALSARDAASIYSRMLF